MKRTATLMLIVGLLLSAPAFAAPDAAAPATKAPATKVVPAAKAAPASQPVEPKMPAEVPKDAGEAMDAAKQVLEHGRAKQWFAMSAGAIWLLMFLFKLGRKNLSFLKKVPRRALWIAVPVLSVAAMVLSKLQADLSWGAALAVLFSGPSVAFLNDLVKRGLLGKEPTSPVNGASS